MINYEKFTFGAEKESTAPNEFQVSQAGYHCERPDDRTPANRHGKSWSPTYDSSIRSRGRQGIEWVSPILQGRDGVDNYVTMTEWMKSMNHAVNASCGEHIHIGVNSVNPRRAWNVDDEARWMATLSKYTFNHQDALYAQTGTRRDRRHYSTRWNEQGRYIDNSKRIISRSKGTNDRSDIASLISSAPRLAPLNLMNARNERKKTVEFRFGAGTLNKSKVLMHLMSCLFLSGLAFQNRNKKDSDIKWGANPKVHSDPSKAGTRALNDLLCKIRMSKAGKELLNTFPIFEENWNSMIGTARRMAAKYDSRY